MLSSHNTCLHHDPFLCAPRQTQGAMPFNLTSSQPIRDLLREIGGEEAAQVMATPTFSVCVNEHGQMFVSVTAGKVRLSYRELLHLS